MRIVVFAEYKVAEFAVFGYDRQCVEFVIPDDVVGLFQAGAFRSGDEFLPWSHERLDFGVHVHTADPVVTAGDQSQESAFRRAVFRHRHGGVAGPLFQGYHFCKRIIRFQVGIALDKSGFVGFCLADHGSFLFDRLRSVDEGDSALLCQSDCQGIAGDGLHDRGNHWDVQGKFRLFAFSILDQRGPQAHIVRDAFLAGIPGNQEILVKCMSWFVDKSCHFALLFDSRSGNAKQRTCHP